VSYASVFVLSVRLLARDFRAGELGVLVAALTIAVAAVTTVAFFADRVQRALSDEAAALLGADLMLSSDRPLSAEFSAEATRIGLATTRMIRFPSMSLSQHKSALTEVKAVEESYPLKGQVRIADRVFERGRAAQGIPAPGTVWVDEKLSASLGIQVGDTITLGDSQFQAGAVILQQPETGVGFLNLAPSLIMNLEDLPGTGLIQTGSRARYALLVAGPAVQSFRDWAASRIGPGQRLVDVREARPEIKAALERAAQFLGLAAVVSVMLAAAASALSARRYLRRHFDTCAMMRSLGASHALIMRLFLLQLAMLGAAASAVGCLLGLLGQQGLALVLGPLLNLKLAAPGILPVLKGFIAGLVLLAGFAVPPLLSLNKVPTLRVLRRDLTAPSSSGVLGYLAGAALIAGLIVWEAGEIRLGGYVLGGVVAVILVSIGAGYFFLAGAAWVGRIAGSSWRLGLANLKRRHLSSLIQIAALSLGLMALLLLTLVRGELLENWRTSVPPDAPNRFLVNIQPDQVNSLKEFFSRRKLAPPAIFPMVRARLVAINDKRVASDDYVDERAKRLIDREFNLSWATQLELDNTVTAGRFWGETASRAEFSVEEGIAQALGIALGDLLTYDIAGSLVSGRVTSLRKVQWDSFRVNFFVIAPPGLLETYPATHITSFYLPGQAPDRVEFLVELSETFPNILVIDVASILAQVQAVMERMNQAMEFVFLFTLASGLLVLYAAIAATRDERIFEAGILRTLGASTRQLNAIQLGEFAALGTLSGLVAALGATLLGWVLASRVLHIPYSPDPWVFVAGISCGAAGVALAGWFTVRASRTEPPIKALRAVSSM
jgi:putative ABC transport system permease protein